MTHRRYRYQLPSGFTVDIYATDSRDARHASLAWGRVIGRPLEGRPPVDTVPVEIPLTAEEPDDVITAHYHVTWEFGKP